MIKILIVDDDDIFCRQLSLYIDRMGYEYKIAGSMRKSLKMAEQFYFDVIFLDVILPDSNGLKEISKFKECPSRPEVVIITGDGDIEGAQMALNNGAWDYLVKPPAFNKIKLLISRIAQFREEKNRAKEHMVFKRESLIGNSSPMRDMLSEVARASISNGNVFITGETGTGKELIANILYENSNRSDAPFIVVDCTNLPENLAANILFGHKKGIYTGAENDKSGLIRHADRGVLFLDEVGDLPSNVQKSLLRVLQEKKIREIGAKDEISCDFRVISASNKELQELVDKKLFRKDLYFRLVVFHINVPPLRERKGDIRLLANHYVQQICEQMDINIKGLSNDFVEALENYEWPGNVRELINVLHITMANAFEAPMLYPHFLPKVFRIKLLQKKISVTNNEDGLKSKVFLNIAKSDSSHIIRYKEYREYVNHLMESKYIDYLSSLSVKNVSEICRMSGLSRSRIYQLFQKHKKGIL